MSQNFDIRSLLGRAFGPIGLPFITPGDEELNPIAQPFPDGASAGQKDNAQLGERFWSTNLLGRPVFMPVKINDIELPNPVITITGSKTIVETVVPGNEGSIKELISTNDYDINVVCFALASDDLWPEQQVQQLAELFKVNAAVTLKCALADYFIQPKDNAVILGINVPSTQSENVQVIEFSLKSNRYYELILE